MIMESPDTQKLMRLLPSDNQMAKEVEQLEDEAGDETERMIKRERGQVKELSTC